MAKLERALTPQEHRSVEKQLSAYLDGMLSRREKARVEAHLRACSACRHNLSTLRQTVDLLHWLPGVPLPRVFALRAPAAAPRARPVWGLSLARLATTVAAVLLVFVLAGDLWLGGFQPTHLLSEQAAYDAAESQVVQEVTRVAEQAAEVRTEVEAPPATVVALAPQPTQEPVVEKMVAAPAPTEAPTLPTPSPAVLPHTRTSEVTRSVGVVEVAPTPTAEAEWEPAGAATAPATPTLPPALTPHPPAPEPPAAGPQPAGEATPVALAPEAGEWAPAAAEEARLEEAPIDWLTVIEIGLAIMVVFMGSATLFLTLLNRRRRE